MKILAVVTALFICLQTSASAISLEPKDAEAQYALGSKYVRGDGVSRDFSKAIALFRKAADQNHSVAQCALGNMYASGWGTPRNDKKAVHPQ